MLRLSLRMADANETLAKEYITKAVTGGLMVDNNDALIVNHFTGGENYSRNSIGLALYNELNAGTCTMGKTWIDWLKNNDDPRLEIVALPNESGEYKGLPNGYIPSTITEYEGVENVNIKTFYSQFNTNVYNEGTPNILLSYAEVELMLAECVYRGFASGDVETHYNNGVTAAMKDYTIYNSNLSISDDDISDYLVANPYDENNALKMINEQYWAATYLRIKTNCCV